MITAYDRTVRTAFGHTRTNALKRNVEWNLSLEEFWEIWDRHWVGRRRRCLQLFRRDHTMPYQVGNAYIGSDKARINARGKSSRERARGRHCECCTIAQFIEVYRQAALVSGEVDHIRALALGGKHCVHNLQILTLAEHRLKTDADMREIRSGSHSAQRRRRHRSVVPGHF
jgi:hypothetical protein